MSKTLVVYGTNYGTSKQYATWIANRLEAKLIEVSRIKEERLEQYDTIIYGGGLYAGGMVGSIEMNKYLSPLKGKKIILFTVGMASTQDTEKFKEIITRSTPKGLEGEIKFFHLRGGMDYSKMNLKHRMMMKAMVTMLKRKKEPLDEDDRGVIETYGKQIDFMDEASIEPIIKYASRD